MCPVLCPYAINGVQCGCLCSGCDIHDYTTDDRHCVADRFDWPRQPCSMLCDELPVTAQGEGYPSCALEGCPNLGHFDPLTGTQERCCERTLAVMEENRQFREMTTRVISLEGNIGTGKSTLLRYLREIHALDLSVVFVDEPVTEWGLHGFLERVYTEPAVGLAFQLMVLTCLVCDLRKALMRKPTPKLVVTERGPHGNYHVFANA